MYQEMLEQLEKSIPLMEGEPPQTLGNWYYKIGRAYNEIKVHDQALEAYIKALEVYTQIGDEESMGNAQMNIGGQLIHLQRHGEAVTHFDEAIKHFEKIEENQKIGR